MSRRAWPNPDGPTGRPIGLVNPINQPETGNELWVKETPLPIETLRKFMRFVTNHTLPNGHRTALPTLPPEDVKKIAQPYGHWAPSPYDITPIPGEAAAMRLSLCFTDLEEMIDFRAIISSGRLPEIAEIDYELEICKQRLWAGMVPLSDRRWAEKKLDLPENIDLAVEHILKVCDMVYFSMPANARKMRQAYNKAYDVLAHFDTVLDAYYASTTPNTPRPSPVPRLADLWAEFFFAHVKFITNRIHAWAASHLDRIVDDVVARLESAPTVPGATYMSPQQNALFTQFENLSHIVRRIDETLLFPLVGFKNTLSHWRDVTSPPIVNWSVYIRSHGATPLRGNYPVDIQQRDEVYHQRVAHLVRQEMIRDRIARGVDALAAAGNVGAFSGEGVAAPTRGVRAAYAEGRRELRGEAEPVQEEMWVGELRRSMEPPSDGTPPRYTKWGFVGYRLCYGHSAEQWATFMQKFEADVGNWGAGVAGAEMIKERLEIRWMDGRDYGIAEGDIDGARKCFKALQEDQRVDFGGLDAPGFLVADQSCIDAYIHDFALPGQTLLDESDLSPFILVATDCVDGMGHEAPGFDGTVRVLGSVLLDDVWPCLWGRHVGLEDMWNLARLHPSCVYVGPVVQSQIEGWEKFGEVRNELVKKAVEWKHQGRLTTQ